MIQTKYDMNKLVEFNCLPMMPINTESRKTRRKKRKSGQLKLH